MSDSQNPFVIDDFRGFYRFLSNYHCAPVEYEGNLYPSTEHAYQAAKTTDLNLRKEFSLLTCPESKRLGNRIKLREDWEQVKLAVMRDVVTQKFIRHADLGVRLLTTGDATLIEGNMWHDNFWGTCRCARCGDKGQNNLGCILMEIRTSLKGAKT